MNDYFTFFYVKHFELPLCMKCAIQINLPCLALPCLALPWLPPHTCTSFTHSHISSTHTLTHCEVLFCYATISERFFRVWFPVYDLDHLLDSESPLPAYCNHICPVYWLPRVFAASPDHKPELWLWFCLAYVVFEASVWTLPVWPPLGINKAAIGSNYTASALQ